MARFSSWGFPVKELFGLQIRFDWSRLLIIQESSKKTLRFIFLKYCLDIKQTK
jgi:hypothetical protein